MRPTRVRTLLVAAAVAAGVGFVVAQSLDAFSTAGLPRLSWITVLLLAALVAFLLLAARAVRSFVGGRRHDARLDALSVARLVAVAKAGALLGALVCGGYAGFGAYALQLLDSSPGQRRVVVAAVTALLGVAVSASALVLERACQVPPDDPDDLDVGRAA